MTPPGHLASPRPRALASVGRLAGRLLPCALAVMASAAAVAPQPREQASPFPWPAGYRAALSLSFDDGRPSQVDTGLPLFEKLGVKATFYVVPGRLAERADLWRRAAAGGHEIGSHSLVHPCSGNFRWSRQRALEDYTLDRMQQELAEATTAIERAVGRRPTTFAYPCGQTFVGRGERTTSYVPLVSRLFLAGRGWLGESPNDPAFVDLAQLTGVSIDTVDFTDIKPVLDQAFADGAWLVLAGHDIGTERGRQISRVSTLEQVVAYARAPERAVWLDTVAAVADHVRQARLRPGQPHQ